MVSSVALYMHEENPAVFDASVPTIQKSVTEVAKPSVEETANVSDNATSKPLTDNKFSSQKSKDSSSTKSEESQSASIDDVEDNLTTPTEKKADMANRAEQIAEINVKNKSTKSLASTSFAKEPEDQLEKIESDQLASAASTVAYAPKPVSTPSTALSAAPMAKTSMSLSTITGSVLPIKPAEQDEAITKTEVRADASLSMSTPVLSIEGVAMGMNREQLVTQGLMCYVHVCHLELSQPQQATYWGLPTLNGHLTAYLSHHVVTKLVLQQKLVQVNQVSAALSNVGITSHESCKAEKGVLLISRQQGANIFNVRSMDTGLSLVICQQTK
jgi:hypothetical protein